jgi:hypothetical protein
MVTTICQALAQVKADLPTTIECHLRDFSSKHPKPIGRRRDLPPWVTLLLFMTQVLHGNTAIEHLRHLAAMTCSASAYCQARMRLSLDMIEHINQCIVAQILPMADQEARWHGHRVFNGDATSFSMPDTQELREHFGQSGAQKPGCGFPVASLMVLCHAAGVIVKTLALPLRIHEAAHVPALHDALEPGDVLVYDRAGCSYTHLALLFQRQLHGIFRMHQRQLVDFRPGRKQARHLPKAQRRGKPKSQWLKRLGRHDQLVRWFKPADRPASMSEQEYESLPDDLVLRELRRSIPRKGFRTMVVTLVTTLVDSDAYPADEIAEQYVQRWQIEVNFRHLKQTMKMDVLKCRSVEGVLKELAVFILIYNLVRLVMLRAAKRQQVPVDRISFIDALRWLCEARHGHRLIDLVVNPKRPDRVEPRVIKRRPKPYPLMTRPRQELRQALMAEKLAA